MKKFTTFILFLITISNKCEVKIWDFNGIEYTTVCNGGKIIELPYGKIKIYPCQCYGDTRIKCVYTEEKEEDGITVKSMKSVCNCL